MFRRLQRMGAMGGGVKIDPMIKVLSQFTGLGGTVSIRHNDTASQNQTTYYLNQILYNNLCVSYQISSSVKNATIGSLAPQMGRKDLCQVWNNRNGLTTPALTFHNASNWVQATDNYYDSTYQKRGQWNYTNTAGEYVEYTTEDKVTEIYSSQVVGITSGCDVIVTIDGDRTLANALPTAQSLVTGGSMSSAGLVANGGPFNPTDRVLDLFANNALYYISLATGLTPGVHVVRLTITSIQNTGGGGPYLYLCSLCIGRTNVALSESNLIFYHKQYIWNETFGLPIDEFAYNMQPTGTNAAEWIGHTGSLKLHSAIIITIDGTPTSVPDLTYTSGTSIVVSFSDDTYHSQYGGGTTSLGVITLSYTVNGTTGFTVSSSYALDPGGVGGVVGGYSSMMTTDEGLARCTYAEATQNYSLSDNDGSTKGNHSTNNFYTWDIGGSLAVLHYIPSLISVDNWSKSGVTHFWYLDNPTWNKAYATRFGTYAYAIGEVWASTVNFRAQWFPNGANVALSK